MRKLVYLIALLLTVGFAQADIPKSIQKKVDKVSAQLWPGNEINYLPVEISRMIDTELFSVQGNGIMLGYVAFTRSMGRYDKFQYAVFYTPDLEVMKVNILKYSSSYGSEITGKRWLNQFKGNKGEKLIYGKDIQAVSGATLSGRAITYDVPKLTRKLKTDLGK